MNEGRQFRSFAGWLAKGLHDRRARLSTTILCELILDLSFILAVAAGGMPYVKGLAYLLPPFKQILSFAYRSRSRQKRQSVSGGMREVG